MKHPLLIFFISLTTIASWWVYALQETTETTSLPSDTIVLPCDESFTWYTTSPVIITEIWFDGTDERIELTNIAPYDIVDTLSISWAKSKLLTLTWIQIPSYTSLILADSASMITWDILLITWLWLSLPDTTGFSLTLTNSDQSIWDSITLDPEMIQNTPNGYSVILTPSFDAFLWNTSRLQATIWQNIHIISPTVANPWVFYCHYPSLEVYDTTWENPDWSNSWNISITWSNSSGGFLWLSSWQDTTDDTAEDISTNNTWYQSWDVILWQDEENSSTLPNNSTSWSTDNNSISGNILQTWLNNTSFSWWTLTPSCAISEIHSVVDVLPEYIEIYCTKPTSGSLIIVWLATSTTTKTIPIHLQTWWHMIVTSSLSWFVDTGWLFLLPWISLRDDWEELTMRWPDTTTSSITYTSIQKWQSYYPWCVSWYMTGIFAAPIFADTDDLSISCTNPTLPTPWYTMVYNTLYQPYFPTKTVYQTNTVTSSTASTTSTSTYYQDLYKKRKDTATSHEKTISDLKKTITTLNKQVAKTTTGSLTKPQSTSTIKNTMKTTTPKSPVKSTTTASKASTTKTTTPKSTTAKTTTKSTTSTPKAKTVSTTSKAYILLTNEHKLYKSYIDFLHGYLKSHLYTQYDTLKISAVQSLLKKSLQTAKQNRTILTYTWWQEISIFDLSAQWQKIWSSEKKSLDQFGRHGYEILSKIVQSKRNIEWIPFLATYLTYNRWKTSLMDI